MEEKKGVKRITLVVVRGLEVIRIEVVDLGNGGVFVVHGPTEATTPNGHALLAWRDCHMSHEMHDALSQRLPLADSSALM